ncbi:MAG TPA: class I SAM-dependent methyltransferase [Nakamurella sp.]
MTQAPAQSPIKLKHKAMWAFGNYDAVATEVIGELGTVIVDAAGIEAGQRVLDVAAGSGNASIPAAERGAHVTAGDLTPELLEIGEQRARERGLDVIWTEADAEFLPFGDGEFDVVTSCVGVMFAPFHQPVADELARVTRPGGTVALINWTPEGFIGRMFGVMKGYVPAPPPGAQPGPLWGTETHVRELFGDRVTGLRAERRQLTVDRFANAEHFRDFFKQYYGPTIAAYRNIADDPAREAALDQALTVLAREAGADTGTMQWEYLLITARRAG